MYILRNSIRINYILAILLAYFHKINFAFHSTIYTNIYSDLYIDQHLHIHIHLQKNR